MERIYLNDWLYNAGIVGFIRINSHLWEVKDEKLISKDENLLKIGDNYIEIDRNIFEGFTDRFFNYAFSLYSKYNTTLQQLRKLINSLNDENFEKINQDLNKILKDYPILKRKVEEFKVKNITELSKLLENTLEIMENDKADFIEDFIENEIRNFLSIHYGQKSFLNKSVKGSKRQKFYEDFEKPLKSGVNSDIGKSSKHICVICAERLAKKNLNFNTGFSTVFGLNEDATNFLWNFDIRIPSCEICEIIYLCSFAGLTKLNGKYYFVNQDNTVESLFVAAGKFERELVKNYEIKLEDFLFVKFFADLLVQSKKLQSQYIIQNINFIEVEIKKLSKTSERKLVKVFNFNIDRKTAEFIKENHENLKSLSKSYFIFPDDKTKVYILIEFLNSILKKSLSYEFLYKTFKSKIKDKAYITNNNLLRLIYMYFLYLKKFGGENMDLEEKNLWAMYNQGQDLLAQLRQRNAENKIQSIAYKLLNALKIGDVKQFMDTLIRVYVAYDLKVPGLVLKAMHNKDNFYLLGYSFLSGLLGKEYKTEEEKQWNLEV